MSGNIMNMLRQTLQTSREKLAAEAEDKTGTVVTKAKVASSTHPAPKAKEVVKIAQACFTLAEDLPNVVDDRSVREKVATILALKAKMAENMADANPNKPHQTKMSPDKPEMNPPMEDGQAPGGPGTAMKSMENDSPGTTIDAGATGKAQVTPPMRVEPSEKANPMDASNALQTNRQDPPGAGHEAPTKIAYRQQLLKLAREGKIDVETLGKMAMSPEMKARMSKVEAAQDSSPGAEKPGGGDLPGSKGKEAMPMGVSGGLLPAMAAGLGASNRQGMGAVGGAAKDGVRTQVLESGGDTVGRILGGMTGGMRGARIGGLLGSVAGGGAGVAAAARGSAGRAKQAEDALNPAQISAPTRPELQAIPSISPALSQGSEAGQLTPPGPSDSRRSFVQSNEGPINVTKAETNHVRKEMAQHISQPANSRANDSSLHQSLDNASTAGVKIAAVKAMLKKWAAEAPENGVALATAVEKAAMGMPAPPQVDAAPPAGGMAPTAPSPGAAGGGAPMGKMGMGEGDPVDAALAAVAAGVTPEMLEAAMMALQGDAMGAEPMPPEMAPMGSPAEAPPPVAEAGPPAGEGGEGFPPPKKDKSDDGEDDKDSPPAKDEE